MEIIQTPVVPQESVLTNPRDLRWVNEEHTAIDMTITHSQFGDIPFTSSADDVEKHSREIFNELKDRSDIIEYDFFYYNPQHPDHPDNKIEVIEV